MDKYELRYAASNEAGATTITFYAHSTANALEMARDSASGSWAELYLNGALVCKMQLVEETGVWLLAPSQDQRPTSAHPD
ncbi:MAG: hypothetical protein AAF250_14975 [Pseudomonadota bacterium]